VLVQTLARDFLGHDEIRAALTHVVLDVVHERTNQKYSQPSDSWFLFTLRLHCFRPRTVPVIAHADGQAVAVRLARDLDLIASRGVLDTIRARLGDCEFHVLDILDGKIQAVRDGRYGQTRDSNPFGLTGNAELDRTERVIFDFMRYRLIHTKAFIAASSSS